MSKRLTDEDMSYFDECVSLSTFDSSDFSSPEDPLLNSLGVATPAVASVSLPHASSSVSASYSPDNCLNDKQVNLLLDSFWHLNYSPNSFRFTEHFRWTYR